MKPRPKSSIKNPQSTIPPQPYRPYGAALQLFYSHDRELLIEGPAGTGKTRAVLEKINLCALKYPGMRALLLRKTRQSLTESALVTFETKVVPPTSPILAGPARPNRQTYSYPTGSLLVVAGLDKSSKIMSTEFDMIAVFEAREISEDDWESLLTRLRNNVMPYQQAILDTNPDAPTHWINRRASNLSINESPPTINDSSLPQSPGIAMPGSQPKLTRLLSRHSDNPSLTPSYLATLNQLTGVRKLRLSAGQWAAREGVVYETYDHAIHLINRFDIPTSSGGGGWRHIRSIDFGYTNPFVCQWWAVDPDGRMYLYREIYQTRTLVEDHARHILALSAGQFIEATITDHDAEDRATLERHGIPTTPAFKSIRPGIQAVHARLRLPLDARPRLALLRDSLLSPDPLLTDARLPTCTEQEFDSYTWPPGNPAPETSAPGNRANETPTDANNHGLDALRYAVAYIDNLHSSPLAVRVC